MTSDEFGIVGSKGELYPPKKIKEALHLEPRTRVRYKIATKGHLIVEIIRSLDDLLMKPSIAKVRIDETESLSESMQERGLKDAN